MRTASKKGETSGVFLKVVAGFLAVGLFLFLHVWLPVQSDGTQGR